MASFWRINCFSKLRCLSLSLLSLSLSLPHFFFQTTPSTAIAEIGCVIKIIPTDVIIDYLLSDLGTKQLFLSLLTARYFALWSKLHSWSLNLSSLSQPHPGFFFFFFFSFPFLFSFSLSQASEKPGSFMKGNNWGTIICSWPCSFFSEGTLPEPALFSLSLSSLSLSFGEKGSGEERDWAMQLKNVRCLSESGKKIVVSGGHDKFTLLFKSENEAQWVASTIFAAQIKFSEKKSTGGGGMGDSSTSTVWIQSRRGPPPVRTVFFFSELLFSTLSFCFFNSLLEMAAM